MSIKDFFLFLILGLSGAVIAATIACDTGTDVTLVGGNDTVWDDTNDPTPGNDCGNIGLGTVVVEDYDTNLPIPLDYIIVEDRVYIPGSKNEINEVNVSDIIFCTVDYTLIINADGYRSVNWTDFTFDPGVTTVKMTPQNPFSQKGNPVWMWRCYSILTPQDCEDMASLGNDPDSFDLCMAAWGGGPCCTIFLDEMGSFIFPAECL